MIRSSIARIRKEPFINGMPRQIAVERLLGFAPHGLAGAPVCRPDGVALMWGLGSVYVAQNRAPSQTWLSRAIRALAPHAWLFALAWLVVTIFFATPLLAQSVPKLPIEAAESPEDVTSTIELMLLLTVMTLAPSILIMTTAFTRIVIVLGFLRMALSSQQLPPTQVLTGLALILTFLVMRPTITDIKDNAIVPYLDAEITQAEAFDRSVTSLRSFMFGQVAYRDLTMFGRLAGEKTEEWQTYKDIDTLTLVPAFVTSELKRGFYMGFMLFLPFLVIDLVVSTVLISMGMLVLPPVLISLPFKILLFVLVDGWNLVVRSLVQSFLPGDPGGPPPS